MGNGPSQPFRTKHLIWFRDRAPFPATEHEKIGIGQTNFPFFAWTDNP